MLRFRLDPIFKISYITGTYCMIFQNLCYISLVEVDPLVKTRKLEVEPPFFPAPAPAKKTDSGSDFTTLVGKLLIFFFFYKPFSKPFPTSDHVQSKLLNLIVLFCFLFRQ